MKFWGREIRQRSTDREPCRGRWRLLIGAQECATRMKIAGAAVFEKVNSRERRRVWI